MYCPTCGAEYVIELKYCNRCGANLNTEMAPSPEPVIANMTKPTLIIGSTMVLLTLGGFCGLIVGAVNLAPVVRGNDPLIAMMVLGMMTIMVVDVFLVRLLTKIINSSLFPGVHPQPRQSNQIANPSVPQFAQPAAARFQGAPSVTEGTTRFFEPLPAASHDRTTAEKLER